MRVIGWLGAAGLLLGLSACLESVPRGGLEVQLLGPAHPRPRCAKGPAELGPVASLGEAVAGARVELSPGAASATSDADGWVRFDGLAEDRYEVRVQAPGFKPADGYAEVESGRIARRQLSLEPCVSAGTNQLRVGFEAAVFLRASVGCGAEWAGSTFSWSQLEGPDVSGTVTSWTDLALRFWTRSIEEIRGALPDSPQVLSFSHDQAGEYVFQVTARSKSGAISRHRVLVTSTDATSGMNSVPTHDVQYFLGPKEGPWEWGLIAQPPGWKVRLGGEYTRTPFVQAMPVGPQTTADNRLSLVNIRGKLPPFALTLSAWDAVPRDCGRAECHGWLQRSWEKTRHGSTWRKLVNGDLLSERGPAAESCATCHALGYDPSVKNGGYDDMASDPAQRFPQVPGPGSYERLGEPLQNDSNVFCLACHGPARVDPPMAEQLGRFSEGVCARCHDRLPEQDLVAQWRTSKMARTIKDDLNGAESRSECSRCHTAQGYYYTNFALGRPPSSGSTQLRCCDNLAPITCQTCHSPMYARNPAQVFLYGAARTASGLDLHDVGAGALCISCHTTDHDVRVRATLERRLAPHSPQAELTYGKGGFAMLLPAGAPALPLEGVACARTAGQGCVTCHMDKGPLPGQTGYRQVGDHTFRMTSREGVANLRPCQACHAGRSSFDPRAGGDYDGDGVVEGARAEVDGLMALLRERLAAQLEARGYYGCPPGRSRGTWFKAGDRARLVVTDLEGYDLGDCNRNGGIEREEVAFLILDPKLYQAAYNYLFLELDGSRGLHNFPYAVKLLQRTLWALTAGHNLPGWEAHP